MFKSEEETDYIELTFVDGSKKTVLYTPQGAILGSKEFKDLLRPKNVRITDFELKEMIPFFNECISANQENPESKFKNGDCHGRTGFTDETCTKFVGGSRLLRVVSEQAKSMYVFTQIPTQPTSVLFMALLKLGLRE